MDFQYWLYIIIAVVYFLSQLRKKGDDQGDEQKPDRPMQRQDRTTTSSAPERQLTFEELLREITEGKQPSTAPREVVQPKSQTAYVDYDDDLEEEEKNLEDVNYDYRNEDKVYQTYEEAKRQAFERPSLEETMKLEDTKVEFGRFKAFDRKAERNLVDVYLADFKDPEGLKKAIVMSEILQRKF